MAQVISPSPLDTWNALTADCVQALGEKLSAPNIGSMFILGLFQDLPFPNFSDEGYSIETDNLNGTLHGNEIALTWCGYASRLYDGELVMKPVTPDARISGTIATQKFGFTRNQLDHGSAWPRFIVMYK